MALNREESLAWLEKIKAMSDLKNETFATREDELLRIISKLDKQLMESEIELSQAHKVIKAHNDEIGEFQDRARIAMINSLSAVDLPGDKIDGGGCDSGDWRDFTLAEIGQAFGMVVDEIHKLRKAQNS